MEYGWFSLRLPSDMRQREWTERQKIGVCGWWGLGLVLPSCGKIPRTFSPNATHNTQMEEGRREKLGRSVDKRNGDGWKEGMEEKKRAGHEKEGKSWEGRKVEDSEEEINVSYFCLSLSSLPVLGFPPFFFLYLLSPLLLSVHLIPYHTLHLLHLFLPSPDRLINR